MRIVSFGNLVCNYYFADNKVIGLTMGSKSANIILNLAGYYNVMYYGEVGNDHQGASLVKILNDANVFSNIKVLNRPTDIVFIKNKKSSNICPYCDRKSGCHDTLDYLDLKKDINENDIIIFENLNNTSILEKLKNKSLLFLDYLGEYIYLSKDELVNLINNKFDVIFLSEEVYNLLTQKFKIDSNDLYDLFNPSVFLILKNNNIEIITNDNFYEKEMEVPNHIVDYSGVKEAIFAEFIKTYLSNTELNEKNISLFTIKASSIKNFILNSYGTIPHLSRLFKIEKYHECICKEIDINNL